MALIDRERLGAPARHHTHREQRASPSRPGESRHDSTWLPKPVGGDCQLRQNTFSAPCLRFLLATRSQCTNTQLLITQYPIARPVDRIAPAAFGPVFHAMNQGRAARVGCSGAGAPQPLRVPTCRNKNAISRTTPLVARQGIVLTGLVYAHSTYPVASIVASGHLLPPIDQFACDRLTASSSTDTEL